MRPVRALCSLLQSLLWPGAAGPAAGQKGSHAAGVPARGHTEAEAVATHPDSGRHFQGRLLSSTLDTTALRFMGTERRTWADCEIQGNNRREHPGRLRAR